MDLNQPIMLLFITIITLLISNGFTIPLSSNNGTDVTTKLDETQSQLNLTTPTIQLNNSQNATNDETSTRNQTNLMHRTAANRDSKLMSLLAARRTAFTREKSRFHYPGRGGITESINGTSQSYSSITSLRGECEKNCTNNFTTRISASCTRRCIALYKTDSNNRTDDNSYSVNGRLNRFRNKIEEKNTNAIADELLQLDESQTDILMMTPSKRYSLNSTVESTEPMVTINTTDKITINHTDSPLVVDQNGNASSPITPTSERKDVNYGTKTVNHEHVTPMTRIYRPANDFRHRRTNITKLYQRDSHTKSTTGAYDLNEYTYFGQKLTPTTKSNEPRNVGTIKISPAKRSPSGAVPPTSVNETKLANNVRKEIENVVNETEPNSSTVTTINKTGNSAVRNWQKSKNIVAYNLRHQNAQIRQSPPDVISAKLSELPRVIKSLDLNDTVKASTPIIPSVTGNVPIQTTMKTTNASDTLPFIIHVEEPAAPETTPLINVNHVDNVPTDPPNYIEFYTSLIPNVTTDSNITTSTTTTESSTTTTLKTTTLHPETRTYMDSREIRTHSSDQTTIATKPSTISTRNPLFIAVNKHTPHTTSRPVKITTESPIIRTTISSSVRSTVHAKSSELPITTPTPTPMLTTAGTRETSSVKPSNFPTNGSNNGTINSRYPNYPSQMFNSSKNFDDILRIHEENVSIEMDRMNIATYVLAGLGMFPIIIIVLYAIKSLAKRRETKAGNELDRPISEVPPISQVVRIEQANGKSSSNGLGKQCHFNRHDLLFKSLLGEGNFGQVWKAEVDHYDGYLGSTKIVAVKTERNCTSGGGLIEEAVIMKKLGVHPNVITLIGACVEKEPHMLVMEYAMKGRLLSILRSARNSCDNNNILTTTHSKSLSVLTPRRLVGFAHDIAKGMEYIASKNIVHRDLAARNVLLDQNGICKICDFGMSIDLERSKNSQPQTRKKDFDQCGPSPVLRKLNLDFCSKTLGLERKKNCAKKPALPIRWMAPEALQYHIFSHETDVWAFGIVLWEILTLGCTPYPDLTGREVIRNVPGGTRPEIPSDCRPEIYSLMTKTWHKGSKLRPSFTEIRLELATSLCQWEVEESPVDYQDFSGFSEDVERGMLYFNRRVPEFECEI